MSNNSPPTFLWLEQILIKYEEKHGKLQATELLII